MTQLYSKSGSHPAPSPSRLVLPDGRTRTNPASFTTEELASAGYVLAPEKPAYDPTTQSLSWGGSDWVVADLPPPPDPVPVDLDALGFQNIVQTVSGMTDADVLAALDDTSLRLMWKRLEMATVVPRDNAHTVSGLDALVATGHITETDRTAILAAWPTE